MINGNFVDREGCSPTLLGFDTSTQVCSVALVHRGKRWVRCEEAHQKQTDLLLPLIHSLLEESGVKGRELQAIACGRGPGSFMGVRLAVSVAQALGFGWHCPIIPLSTLEIVAQSTVEVIEQRENRLQDQALQMGVEREGFILSGWDARMGEIYFGGYHWKNDCLQNVIPDQLIAPQALELSQHPVQWILAGNAWSQYWDLFPLEFKEQIARADYEIVPDPNAILTLAERYFCEGRAIAVEELVPVYLREKVTHR